LNGVVESGQRKPNKEPFESRKSKKDHTSVVLKGTYAPFYKM